MPINDWPYDERPREKLLNQGAGALSVAELLAILLRTGTKGCSALMLARQLLNKFGSLQELAQAELAAFSELLGLGEAKYIQVQAALELNRRLLFEEIKETNALENSVQTRRYLLSKLGGRMREVFACLFLDAQYHVLGFVELFQGSIGQADVYPREVVKSALAHNAAAVIISHNHPSGSVEPSDADRQVTVRLKLALDLVDIRLLDHVIIGQNRSFSFVDQGLL